MRISDWSSDVCSSDLRRSAGGGVLMSRIGKKAVEIPSGVTAAIDGGQLSVKGPKGTLAMPLSDIIKYDVGDGAISVQPANASREARAFWGMQRTLVQNLITGVKIGRAWCRERE